MTADSHSAGEDYADSAPGFAEDLVRRAEEAEASDVHLQMRDSEAGVAFRVDGVLTPVMTIPAALAERVFGRLKFLARLKTYQESLPQDGRIDKESVRARADIRVATYPTVTGEKVVMRFFQNRRVHTLETLGFPEEIREQLRSVLARVTGLVLLTGPAGSGKTTTIYACLNHLAEVSGRHIITVEDPVEQVLPGIMQTETNEARGLTFAVAARHLLRQDPQVLVIGEVRDEETARIAARAALTGHLVISTLHAGSCRGVFERLYALCGDASAVASSTELVLNQRLLRRFCLACKGNGCASCLQTGFRGRVPIVESVLVTAELRPDLHRQRLDRITPNTTLLAAAEALVQTGITSTAEVTRTIGTSHRL